MTDNGQQLKEESLYISLNKTEKLHLKRFFTDKKGQPILMLHGTADTRVNVEQSRLLASALNVANHTNKLVTYEGDNHGLTQHRTAAFSEIKDWLQQYLVPR